MQECGKINRGVLFYRNFETMKKYLLASIFICWLSFGFSQEVPVSAFQAGEEITYIISYNWGFIWLDVGEATFKITGKEIKGKKYFVITAIGQTYKSWDKFFKVRDLYQTVISQKDFKPVYYVRDVDEGGYTINIKYRFNRHKKVAYSEYKSYKKPFFRDTIPITDDTYDLMSIIYRARNLDYSKMTKGEKIPISILLDNELTNIFFRYKGPTVFKNKKIGKYNTINFSVMTVAGEVFKSTEESLQLWVSDDKNRLPLWIESPISVGSVKVRLAKYKGLKYPLSSKIK